LVSAVLAWLVSRALGHPARERGAFIACLSMSNNGFTMLGFVALALFGEQGLAQAAYAQLLYTPFFLLVCFPIGRHYGRAGPERSLGAMLLHNAKDPRVWLPLLAMAIGLGLNLTRVPRPALAAGLTRLLIYAGTITSSVAIGLLWSGFRLWRYWRENAASFLYRSTLYPLLYFGLAKLTGLAPLDTQILVLYGLVPSALLANLLAALFALDIELTLSVFIVSTALFLALVLPLFGLLVRA
jgi:predicted permease